jgi:hypothetical protein
MKYERLCVVFLVVPPCSLVVVHQSLVGAMFMVGTLVEDSICPQIVARRHNTEDRRGNLEAYIHINL